MSAINVVEQYGAALAAGDMAAFEALLAPGIVWHQPGTNSLSGDHVGPAAVLAHLGSFMGLSGGTFALATDSATEAGNLVSTTVTFSAQRPDGRTLSQRGVDVFRIEGALIAEIWLMSEDQDEEDAFWG